MSMEVLRKQLMDYGVIPGPITPTTFPVYVRKLSSLCSSGSRVNQELRRASAGRSVSGRVSAAAGLNGFSSDDSDAESDYRRGRLSMSANHGVASYYDRTKRSNQVDVTGSGESEIAQPERSSVRSSSAYEQLALVRPSIQSYKSDSSTTVDRYGISKSDTSPFNMQTRSRPTTFQGSENSYAALAGSTASIRLDESRHSWQLISGFIVILVMLLITVVIVSYCFITRSSQFPVDTRSDFILCSDHMQGETSSLSRCTSQSQIGLVHKMIRELLDALSTRAGEYDCGYQSEARSMRRSEIIQLLEHRMLITDDKKAAEYLGLIAKMCTKNDHWGVMVHGDSEDNSFALESVLGRKSLWCRFTDSVRYMFSVVIVTFLFIGAGCGLFVLIRIRRTVAEAERQEVFDLVEKIIDLLRQNAAASEAAVVDAHERPVPPYLAIPHVRDALIPLHLRRAKQRIWDQAVKFLSAHESRVRVEHQKLSGEGLLHDILY